MIPRTPIPKKRDRPRVVRDRAPRPKQDAVKVYPDGREVCSGTPEGMDVYCLRRIEMWERQSSTCAICGEWLSSTCITFDHEDGRTSGHKNEKLWRDDGRPMNAAVHLYCNIQRGSKRTPYKFQYKGTRAEWDAMKGEK